ncbi:DUF397 domain-containing protein [Pseudonocardia spinosispora]|uniref:DUF397 domain-containing protein n=1 Tax=Pseudonocardia spinosispora TaxID=103441 RepID=UPI0004256635|nr:DUF397 domain-containing protein [Pseudonocardia spinosispora]
MLTWFKSSHSDDNEACVEVAVRPDGTVLLRDSKIGDTSPILTFTATQWQTFLATADRH